MARFKRIYDLTIIQKISLAGIFIVLIALFQKIFAVNYIPVLPFVRISFGGPALIIFASILLGPWFGMLVGAASDIVGFYIFDPTISLAAPTSIPNQGPNRIEAKMIRAGPPKEILTNGRTGI